MGTAKYIGRVGGLAVALGVGIAVATTPGVAWADDTGSASSEGSTGTAGATGTNGTSEPEGTSTTTGTTTEPTGTSTAAGSADGGRLHAGVWFGGRLQVGHLGVDGRIGAAGAAGDGDDHWRRALVNEVEQRHLGKGRCGRRSEHRGHDPAETRRGPDGERPRGAGRREGTRARPEGRLE